MQRQPPNRRPEAFAAEAAWHAAAVARTADTGGTELTGLDAAAARHDVTAKPVAARHQQAARASDSDDRCRSSHAELARTRLRHESLGHIIREGWDL